MKRNKSKKIGDKQALLEFTRILHSQKVLRAGLSRARQIVDPCHIPLIVKSLGAKPIYRSALATTTFPTSYDQYGNKTRLGGEIGEDKEIMWSASVISLYQKELKSFIKYKLDFFKKFLSGKNDDALKVLDEIQKVFGVSFWLISQKLQILQDLYGLKAQKDFLEEILVTKGFWQHISWLSYYISLRAEEGVTFSNYESQLSDVFHAGEVGDFAICKVIPYDLTRITSLGTPLAWFETASIIDRFETLVPLLVLYSAKYGKEKKELIIKACELLESTDDKNIQRLLCIFKENISQNNREHEYIDLYTQGRYEEIIQSSPDNLELLARAYAAAEIEPMCEDLRNKKSEIIKLMYSIITVKDNLQDCKESLKKYALICSGHKYYYQIVAFLERKHDHLYVNHYSIIDKMCALSEEVDNPWSLQILSDLIDNDFVNLIGRNDKNSISFVLRNALYSADGESIIENASWLPEYRKRAYLGHYHLYRKNYEVAIGHYSFVVNLERPYISDNIKRYLLRAFIENNKFKEALHLIVEHLLDNPSSSSIYPIEELVKKFLQEENLLFEVDLSILLHIAIVNGITEYERDISNIYENILEKLKISLPSEMHLPKDTRQQKHVIYFLKNVCVQRVMDDSTFFDSVDEIDNERIRICQKLLVIDPENRNIYLDEIRILTKDINVARLLAKVQTSKIYVDETGIRQVLEQSLKGSLARYKLLLDSPSLAYQAEKLSRILGEMLSDRGHPEFRDLKLPATESEGLFTAMLLEATSQFALNPAYGLDTHVSTSIRHGAFEGHLRSPLAVENLLCPLKDGQRELPLYWEKRYSKIPKHQKDLIKKSLQKFTSKIESIISTYLKEKLHMRIVTREGALFSFHASAEINKQLMDSITIKTELTELIDIFIGHCWAMTTKSIENIKNQILSISAEQFATAFDQLSNAIESLEDLEEASYLNDAIAKARTEFQVAIGEVASWFQKPKDLTRESFEFELALDVASKQALNCYLDTPLKISKQISIANKIEGKLLDGLCEIIFILLQNVIRHGGISVGQVDVEFSAYFSNESLVIECKNQLSEEIDFNERLAQAERSMQAYEMETALRKARNEGGSGLSKVWRIAEYNLKVEHKLFMHVDSTRRFTCKLELNGIEVSEA